MVLVAAIVLIWVCAMGLVQSQRRIPAGSYFDTHQAQFEPTANDSPSLDKALGYYRQMQRDARGAEEWRRLAALLLMTKSRHPEPDENRLSPTEQEVRTALVASLAREPSHPLTWAYLADSELRFAGDMHKAAQELEQSYRVAPLEPDFFFYRLGIALRCKPQWNLAIVRYLRREMESLFPAQGENRNAMLFIQRAKSDAELRVFANTLLRQNQRAFGQYQMALRGNN